MRDTLANQNATLSRKIPLLLKQRAAIGFIVLGLIARVILACFSWGTADANTWHEFGRRISAGGLLPLYHTDPTFNHPPLAGYFAGMAYYLANVSGISFSLIFKLPSIAADTITCLLLWRIDRRAGPWIAAAFAWNLDSILVTGHHCNTDSIYATLCLASDYLVEGRGAHFLSGLALGAAINVKLIPVV